MTSEVIRPLAFRSEMVEHWQWHKLEDICEGIFDCPHSTQLLTDSGPYVARSQDIRTGVFKLDLAGRVSEETYKERITRAEPGHGDLLFSREGTYFGIAAEVPPNIHVCLGQRMVLIRPNANRLNFRFLRYWLNSQVLADHMHGFRDGTVAERLNMPTIRRLPVVVPPLPIQEDIATTLGTIDDKIELNRRMNATLEQMAQALFKSWFVDFDPVKAKAEGRAPEGMDADTAALFPSEFEESELRPIPKGWQCLPLKEAFEVNPPRGLAREQEANYLDMANVPTQGHRPVSWIKRPFGSGTRFINGDTLLARITPCLENGKTAFVDFLPEGESGWGSTEFIVLHPKPPLPEYFAYLLCREQDFRAFAIQSMTGTSGRQRVQTDLLGKYLLAVPSDKVAVRFGEIIAPLVARISRNSEESNSLAEIRDALLPRLISGQLRVPDAEKMGRGV